MKTPTHQLGKSIWVWRLPRYIMSTEWLLTAISTAFWDSLKNVEDKTREYENHVWYPIPSWNLWWRSEVQRLLTQIFISAPVQSNARSGLNRTLHTIPDYTDYRWLYSWKRIALFQFPATNISTIHRAQSRLTTTYFTAEYLMYSPILRMIQQIVNTNLSLIVH